jgi:hypothetical protein
MELIVWLGVTTIIVGAAAVTMTAILRSDLQAKRIQVATDLTRELSDNARAFAAANWRNIYDLNKGSSNHYYLITTASPFATTTGDEALTIESVNYVRYFYVENANRTLCGAGVITTDATTTCAQIGMTGVADDPSTQRLTVVATWPGTTTGVRLVEYVSRSRNTITRQTDWSGGSGQESFPSGGVNNQFASSTGVSFTGTPGSLKVILP